MVEAGYKPEDITVRVDRDQAKMYGEEYAAEKSGLKQYKVFTMLRLSIRTVRR